MKSLIIVPAFNEGQNLPGVVKDLRKNCPESDILAVNDCSTDDTLQVLEKQSILFLNLPVNLGIGGAVQSGYKYAVENGYDIAVQFDGDGQHDAKYVKALMEPIETGTDDLVIRENGRGKENYEMFLKFWPAPIAKCINFFYSDSDKSNHIEKNV